MKEIIIILTAIMVVLLAASAGHAAAVCGERSAIASKLARYGETSVAFLVVAHGKLTYELFGSSQSGTWSTVWVDTHGWACIRRTGRGFSNPSGVMT